MQSKQIFDLLTREYSIILATTENDFKIVKALRTVVLSAKYSMSPQVLESKGYFFNQDDQQSFIYLLRHNSTDKYIGTVRVFFINKHTPVQEMPMQKDGNVKGIATLTQELPICEISRLALSNELPENKDFSSLELHTYLSLALMTAARINFFLYHYSNIFAIMERSLQRILKRQHVYFDSIGDAVDYNGMRFPFVIQQKNFLIAGKKTEETMGQLTKYYLKDLCKNPDSFWKFIDNNPYLERSDIQLDRICKLFKEYGDDVDMSLLLGLEKDTAPTPTV